MRFNQLYLLFLLSPALIFPTFSVADTKLVPRTSISYASYKFTQSARPNALAPTGVNGNDFPEVNFNVNFKILGLGATVVMDQYYIDLSTQFSTQEEDTFSLSEGSFSFSETFRGDRKDAAITFGKKILNNKAAVYIGLKTGKSQADGNQGQSLTFEETGYFIGGNYSWLVAKKGVFSINAAYADLKGDLIEKVTNPSFSTLTVPLDTDATSNATGISYGFSWASKLTQSINYSISIESKNYTFTDIKDSNPKAINSDKFKEEFTVLNLTLYYSF